MNEELGGEAIDDQITDHFCNQYMDIWFFKHAISKESDIDTLIKPQSYEKLRCLRIEN
jgi:hypothetical protein